MQKLEKTDLGSIVHLQKILDGAGVKTTSEYLKKKGLVNYNNWGWIHENRMQVCINEGLIVYSSACGDFILTDRGCKFKVLNYLVGDVDKIIER